VRFRFVLLAAVVWLAIVPSAALASAPGPLLQKAADADPVLAERLAGLEADAKSRGVDSPIGGTLQVVPGIMGIPELTVAPQAVTTGELKTLAILVDFSDHQAQVADTFFDNLLFADVYGPGSLRGYYREVSYGTPTARGLLDVTTADLPSVVGWVRLPQTLAYYAGTSYGRGTYPNNSQKMVEDALAIVDQHIDFSEYDNDGDGYVDNIMVIHAGEGAEFNGPIPGHIWSHAWGISRQTRDGVYIQSYSTEPEYWATPGDMRPGVYAHEMGHTMGLPDLYDRDDSNGASEGIGEWSLMASGSWNGVSMYGDSPARLDAWSSEQLGWLQPQTATGTVTMRNLPAVASSRAASAWKVYPNGGTSGSEYWLIENRQRTGTDADIPGSGVLVWHVDEAMSGYFDQNDDETHKLVDLEEAAGVQSMDADSDRGTAADPYPGTSGNRTFNASSVPNSNLYSGAASLVVVDSVSDSGANMTARIGSVANTMSMNSGATYVNSTSATINSSVASAATMRVDVGTGFGAWLVYSTTRAVTLPAGDGSKTVTVEYRNAALETIASLSDSIVLDASAPSVSSLASSSHLSEASWYANSTGSFTWASADPGSGIAGYSYVLDSSASTTPDTAQDTTSGSATVSAISDGLRYFHVRAVDHAGNWGPASHRAVRVDRVAPSTTTPVEPTKYMLNAQISLSAADPLSGVASTVYTLDGGAETPYTTPFDVTTLGLHTLTYHSHDNAGNSEAAKSVTFSVVEDVEVDLVPIEGEDRFTTAVETSKIGFDDGADTVLIATGRNWPDALGASSLAGVLDAPILLVEKSLIPAAVSAEISRLGATKAIIIGGTGAVDDDVKQRLLVTGDIDSVRRIAGTDRYDTARKVAVETIAVSGDDFDGTLFVATGQNYADALAASPAAAANGWPTILVPSNSDVPAATMSFVAANGERAVILGGISAVSYAAYNDLWAELGSSDVERIGGSDRFDTAVKVADWSVDKAGLTYCSPAIATGRSPYDALAGGVVQGCDGSVLLLTESAKLPSATSSAIADHAAAITEVRFLGGLGAVSQSVRNTVVALVAP